MNKKQQNLGINKVEIKLRKKDGNFSVDDIDTIRETITTLISEVKAELVSIEDKWQ